MHAVKEGEVGTMRELMNLNAHLNHVDSKKWSAMHYAAYARTHTKHTYAYTYTHTTHILHTYTHAYTHTYTHMLHTYTHMHTQTY